LQGIDITAQAQATFVERSVAFTKAHVRLILVVYGILCASLGLVLLDRDIHGADAGLSPYRLSQIASSMDMVNEHGPPLTAARSDDQSSLYPIAIDDDRGGFIYLPLAAYLLKTRDIHALLKWSFILFFLPLLLVYPSVLFELTGSVAAAIAAPPILLTHSTFFRTSGFFWVPAWANLLLLPLLLLIAQRWRESRLWLLIPLAVVASFASSVRANAGLGFVIGSLVLIFLRAARWRIRLSIAALVLLAYLSISSFAMHAVQVQRDEVVGHDFTSPYPNGHPLWHNLYMGLGYQKNAYGIRIRDAAAVAAAKKEDPGAAFPTKRYEHALRTVYFKTMISHPEFVSREYLVKAGVIAGSAVLWFPGAVVLAPILVLFGKPADRRRRLFALILIMGAGLVGAATGVLVNPTRSAENQSGWYSFLLLLWLLTLGWFARPVEEVVLPALSRSAVRLSKPVGAVGWNRRGRVLFTRVAGDLASLLHAGRTRTTNHLRAAHIDSGDRLLRIMLVAVIAISLFTANALTRSSYASAVYWTSQGPLLARQDAGRVVSSSTFEAGVPNGWFVNAQTLRRREGQLLVKTNQQRYGHQIDSAPHVLQPGRYLLQVHGRVISGALQLGVVDDRDESLITSNIYWSGQRFRQGRHMGLSFELAKEAPIKIILTNYSQDDRRALWLLQSIELLRLPGGCRLFDPSASFGPLAEATR
jgi:hypothetical protein